MGVCVGIDVSKQHLDWVCGAEGEAERASNGAVGVRRLVARLRKIELASIIVESTGGYERRLTEALTEADLPVVLVNPWRVRRFAEGLGILAKTDPLDARVLALFGERARPPRRPLPGPRQRALADLLRRPLAWVGPPCLLKRRCGPSGLTDQIDPSQFRHQLIFRLVRVFCVVGGLRVVRLVILGCIPGVLRLVVQLIAIFFHRRFFVWLIGPWRERERALRNTATREALCRYGRKAALRCGCERIGLPEQMRAFAQRHDAVDAACQHRDVLPLGPVMSRAFGKAYAGLRRLANHDFLIAAALVFAPLAAPEAAPYLSPHRPKETQ